jgi:hypothetical protein
MRFKGGCSSVSLKAGADIGSLDSRVREVDAWSEMMPHACDFEKNQQSTDVFRRAA